MALENGNGYVSPEDYDPSPYDISPDHRVTDVIVNFPLSPDGKNYARWSAAMSTALLLRSKISFIDGTMPPLPPSSPDFLNWSLCDGLVRAWICNSIEQNSSLYTTAIYAKSAKDLWDYLSQLFYRSPPARIYELMEEISRLKQAGLTVAEYYAKLTNLWHELDGYMPGCTCECGAAEYRKVRENKRLCQFLIGLDSGKYRNAKIRILNSQSLPSLRQAYAMVVMEELANMPI